MKTESVETTIQEKAKKLLRIKPRVSVSKKEFIFEFVDTLIEELLTESYPFAFYWNDLTLVDKQNEYKSLVKQYRNRIKFAR